METHPSNEEQDNPDETPIPVEDFAPPPPQNPISAPAANNPADPPSNDRVIRVKVIEDDELKPFERKMYWLTFAALAVAALTGAIFYTQLGELGIQNKILSDQSISITAAGLMADMNTKRQLDIAQKQVKAAQDSVAVIQRQMRVEQRPWIKVTLKVNGAVLTEGNTLSGSMAFVNTGKTPAKHVFSQTIIQIAHSGKEIRFIYSGLPSTKGSVGILEPNAPIPEAPVPLIRKTGKPFPDVETRNLTKQEAIDLDTGKAFIVIRSLVMYDDIFNVHHWTKACAFSAFRNGAYDAKKCSESQHPRLPAWSIPIYWDRL